MTEEQTDELDETTGQLFWQLVWAIIRFLGAVGALVLFVMGIFVEDDVEGIRYLVSTGLILWTLERDRK